MRLFFSAVIVLLGLEVSGQLPSGIKHDNLIWTADSGLVCILYKSKSSVYSLNQKKFVFESTKLPIIHLKGIDGFLLVDNRAKNARLCFEYRGHLINLSAQNGRINVHIPAESTGTLGVYPGMNGWLLDPVSGDRIPDTTTYYGSVWQSVEIEFLENDLLRIVDYRSARLTYLEDLAPDYAFSGVYDLMENRWTIPAIYESCYPVNNFFFCLKPTGKMDEHGNPYYTYDFFSLQGRKAELKKTGITGVQSDELREILDLDEIEIAADSVHYVVKKNGKFGLIRFQLMDNWSTPQPHFCFNVVVPAINDLVVFSPEFKIMATIQAQGSDRVALYQYVDGIEDENNGKDEFRRLIADSVSVSLGVEPWPLRYCEFISGGEKSMVMSRQMNAPVELTEIPFEGRYHNFSVQLVFDSLVLIEQNRQIMVREPNEDTVPILNQLDEVDASMFLPEVARISVIRVFNLNSQTWLLNEDASLIFANENGFLAYYGRSPGKGFMRYNLQGNGKGAMLLMNDALREYEVLRTLTNCESTDTIFEAPGGFERHTANYYHKQYHYVAGEGKMHLYYPAADFSNRLRFPAYEFIHYNPDLDYVFYILNDSLHFESPFYQVAVELGNGTFISAQTSAGMLRKDAGFSVRSGNKSGDITTFGSVEGFDKRTVSIEVSYDDGLLIVNDRSLIESWYQLTGTGDSVFGGTIEGENSAVWRKKNTGWVKQTPYYASVFPAGPQFYIAKTGRYFKPDLSSGDSESAPVDIPARYLLLDTSFNVISYVDYFDFPDIQDLGFGLKIRLDSGDQYFFMTYSGQAVTNAEWDDFELERGKLKAILNSVYLMDESGNLILDEFGNPQEQVFATTRYFALP